MYALYVCICISEHQLRMVVPSVMAVFCVSVFPRHRFGSMFCTHMMIES